MRSSSPASTDKPKGKSKATSKATSKRKPVGRPKGKRASPRSPAAMAKARELEQARAERRREEKARRDRARELSVALLGEHGRPLPQDLPSPERLRVRIRELYALGWPAENIARTMDLPVKWVADELDLLAEQDRKTGRVRGKPQVVAEDDFMGSEEPLTYLSQADLELAEERRARKANMRARAKLRQQAAGLFGHLPPGESFLTAPPELADHPAVVGLEERLGCVARRQGLR
jgi:hypothetical protein